VHRRVTGSHSAFAFAFEFAVQPVLLRGPHHEPLATRVCMFVRCAALVARGPPSSRASMRRDPSDRRRCSRRKATAGRSCSWGKRPSAGRHCAVQAKCTSTTGDECIVGSIPVCRRSHPALCGAVSVSALLPLAPAGILTSDAPFAHPLWQSISCSLLSPFHRRCCICSTSAEWLPTP
jgi:hypothetical protein